MNALWKVNLFQNNTLFSGFVSTQRLKSWTVWPPQEWHHYRPAWNLIFCLRNRFFFFPPISLLSEDLGTKAEEESLRCFSRWDLKQPSLFPPTTVLVSDDIMLQQLALTSHPIFPWCFLVPSSLKPCIAAVAQGNISREDALCCSTNWTSPVNKYNKLQVFCVAGAATDTHTHTHWPEVKSIWPLWCVRVV